MLTNMDRTRADHLKDIGRNIAAPDHLRALIEEAYAKYRTSCLWSIKEPENPTIATAMVVAGYLKRNGNTAAFHLAGKIESASDAAVRPSSSNH